MGLGAMGLLVASAFLSWKFANPPKSARTGDLGDQALLALIKNDQAAFEAFIASGGDVHSFLPLIDGKFYTVSQGLSYFDRPGFVKFLQSKKIKFIRESQDRSYDVLSLSIPKNNPELMELYIKENPGLSSVYGDKEWTLLHLTSVHCSPKLVAFLNGKGKLGWNVRAKDGSTPLTLAAEYECLPVLSFWKNQKADFKAQDGKGRSALSILKKKKDAALLAFAESLEVRTPAGGTPTARPEVNFYKKRQIPKERLVDHTALIEPEARPIEPIETAEMSEFAD